MCIKALKFFLFQKTKSKNERANTRADIYQHLRGEGPSKFQRNKRIIKQTIHRFYYVNLFKMSVC